MKLATNHAGVLASVERWARRHDLIRLVLLTSSRARPEGPVDLLSDYDIVLVVAEPAAFAGSDDWLRGVGQPLIVVRDSEPLAGIEQQNRMVLYDDGTKIDYSIWPLAVIERAGATGRLPAELDAGYRILLDKDDRARTLPPPSHRAYIPAPPTAAEFRGVIEEIWWCATYVAKNLWRNELMPAKVILDYEMKYLLLRRLLEWRIELDHQWSVRPGFFGRGLQHHLDPALWAEFAATYVGPGKAENWTALYRTIELSRGVAIGVGRDLGYAYPHALDATMMAYLRQIQDLG